MVVQFGMAAIFKYSIYLNIQTPDDRKRAFEIKLLYTKIYKDAVNRDT